MTSINPPLTFVSNSEAKQKEYQVLLGMPDLLREPMREAESTNTQLDMLVREKCEKAAKYVNPPIFVEHTALEIVTLNGYPGVITEPTLSKTLNSGLLKMMTDKGDRSAVAKIAIGYLQTPGAKIKVLEAETMGHISSEPHGTYGFGWDQIFVPEGNVKTFAEMTLSEKNQTSMRAKVAHSFKILLQQVETVDAAQLAKRGHQEGTSKTQEKPPDNIQQAFLRKVWSAKPWIRNVVLGVVGLVLVAFALWASFPDSVKQRIIDWLIGHPSSR